MRREKVDRPSRLASGRDPDYFFKKGPVLPRPFIEHKKLTGNDLDNEKRRKNERN